VDRSLDVVGFATGKGIDYFFPSTLGISLFVNNNSNKAKSAVIVAPLQIIPPYDPNEKK
jgi:hypothetical protein